VRNFSPNLVKRNAVKFFFTKFSDKFIPLFGEPYIVTDFSPNLVKKNFTNEAVCGSDQKKWETFSPNLVIFSGITKFGEKSSDKFFTKNCESRYSEIFFSKFCENFRPFFGIYQIW